MSVEIVKSLIGAGDLQTLYENDQVCKTAGHGIMTLTTPVEYTNGGWTHLSPLFRVKNHIHANV